MANGTQGVTLPPGYEDAKPAVQAMAARANVVLPKGFEDAQPATAMQVSSSEQRRVPPGLATEATSIGPRRALPGIPVSGRGLDVPGRVEDFLHPTSAYRKEHPILGGLGEGLRNLRETFTPGAMAAGVLLGGPGGPTGEIGPSQVGRPTSVPAMSLPGAKFPRVSAEPRPLGGTPTTVFDEPRQLGPVPQAPPRIGPPRPVLGTSSTETPLGRQSQPLGTFGPARSPRGYFNPGRGKPSPSIDEIVNQATGAQPLKPDVPLREQITTPPSTEPIDPIKAKYPDPNVRQMVRANGERIYEAAKRDPATVKAIHDLTRTDLRQALINAGEDMGQMTVSNSKFAGQGSISREDAFNRLLEKGLRPAEIVRLAKQNPGGTATPRLLGRSEPPQLLGRRPQLLGKRGAE